MSLDSPSTKDDDDFSFESSRNMNGSNAGSESLSPDSKNTFSQDEHNVRILLLSEILLLMYRK